MGTLQMISILSMYFVVLELLSSFKWHFIYQNLWVQSLHWKRIKNTYSFLKGFVYILSPPLMIWCITIAWNYAEEFKTFILGPCWSAKQVCSYRSLQTTSHYQTIISQHKVDNTFAIFMAYFHKFSSRETNRG